MFRTSLIVTAFSLFASIVGFLNQIILAKTFGAGAEMDVYLLSISIPLTLNSVLSGVLGYQLVPALQRAVVDSGSDDRILRALSRGLGGASLLVGIVGFIYAKELVVWFRPEGFRVNAGLDLDVGKVAWFWLPLAVLATIYTAALHVRSRFITAAFCQVLPIMGTLAGCLIGSEHWGLSALVWGQLFGYCVMLAIVLTCVGRLGGGSDWIGLKNLAVHFPLAYISLLIFVFYPFADSILGSRVGPSAVSYLGYSQRLIVGIASLTVAGATTVMFPRMAKQAAEGQDHAVRGSLISALRVILLIITPVACLAGVFSLELTQLIFQRGVFSAANSIELAALLPYMLLGIVAASCMTLVFKVFFANGRIYHAAFVSILGVASYFFISLCLIDRMGVRGIGAAYAASWWLVLAVSLWILWRSKSPRRWAWHHVSFGLCIGIGAAVVVAVGCVFSTMLHAQASNYSAVALVGLISAVSVIGLGLYLFVLYVAEIPEVLFLFKHLRSQ